MVFAIELISDKTENAKQLFDFSRFIKCINSVCNLLPYLFILEDMHFKIEFTEI
jgi:hypothetical protein